MPLTARSINFAHIITLIQTGSIKSAAFSQAMSTSAAGVVLWGEIPCPEELMSVPAARWREDVIPTKFLLGPTGVHYQLEQAQSTEEKRLGIDIPNSLQSAVMPMTDLVQETATCYIHLTCLEGI